MKLSLTTQKSPNAKRTLNHSPAIQSKSFFILKFIPLLACVVYLFAMNALNVLPVDRSDGIQHFSIAQVSWKHPLFLLDHWGKPLFTLLSSPFAQFGFKAYVSFNIFVFSATCLIAFRLFKHVGPGLSYYVLFPVLLLCVPDYTYCVLGGMTEPLFGLIMVALIYCGWQEKWVLFAILASFAPFARSEGMLLVALAAGVLLLNRRWKLVPLVFTGFIMYAFAGWFALGSFWWFFEMDPYPQGSIYGSGNWYHYLVNMDDHTGVLTLLILPLSAWGWMLYQRKNPQSKVKYTVFFGIGVYAGIICIHSYFWACGLKGSFGLTRIATLGLPGFMLLVLAGASFLTRVLPAGLRVVLAILISAGIVKELSELKFPKTANPLEKVLLQAADYSKKAFPAERIYLMNPLIAWRMGENLKDPDSRLKQVDFKSDPMIVSMLEEGSIVIRDPVFGPKEQGLPLEFVNNRQELVEIKIIGSDEVYPLYTGEALKIRIFRVVKAK